MWAAADRAAGGEVGAAAEYVNKEEEPAEREDHEARNQAISFDQSLWLLWVYTRLGPFNSSRNDQAEPDAETEDR